MTVTPHIYLAPKGNTMTDTPCADKQTGAIGPAPMLSRLSFDVFHPDGRRAVSDPYRMHQATCSLVGSSRADANLLWRVDEDTGTERIVLMQSTAPMDYNGEGPPVHVSVEGPRDMGGHLDRLAEGSRVRYAIDVNAVWQPNGGKKLKAVPRIEIPEWWVKKADRIGLKANPDNLRHSTENRHIRGQSGRLLFLARINGIGQVTSPARLRAAITNGIGKSKAFGCGLLTIQHLA